jgi:type I restriction enzyme M protein
MVIEKGGASNRQGIFMIDASQGFMKDGPKNRLRSQDIHKIVDVFTKFEEVEKYSRMVPFSEIEKNEYNLNLPRYIDSQKAEDLQDIEGHLKGGIPVVDVDALKAYWEVCPKLRKTLFKDARKGYVQLAVEKSTIKTAIFEHEEFSAFTASMNAHFDAWKTRNSKELKSLKIGHHPKDVIASLGEELLTHYKGKALIDAYDVYQHLMDYWATTMQDDCYLIASSGWKAETYRVFETKKGKDGKPGKQVDKGWTCDLIPKELLVAKYFAKERGEIEKVTADLEAITAQIAEMEEEHGGEEGAFSELDKVNKASASARLKEIKNDPDAKEESAILRKYVELCESESELKKKVKDLESALDEAALKHYPKLKESDVKDLVVDSKWLAALDAAIHAEMDRVSQSLTARVKELAERYESALPSLMNEASVLEKKVSQHLQKMGFV